MPVAVEIFVMEITLEIMKEAGVRMPTSIGQTVSFLGAVVIGQSAVAAGFIGPATVIVVALTTICSFAIPSLAMTNTITIIRLPLLILSSTFGLFGLSCRSYCNSYFILCHFDPLEHHIWRQLSPYDKNSNKDVINKSTVVENG